MIALAAHFITSNTMKNNITAIGSGILFSIFLIRLLEDAEKISEEGEMAILFSCFLMLMAVSKIVFPKAIITKKDGRTVFDTALLSGWIIIPLCSSLHLLMNSSYYSH